MKTISNCKTCNCVVHGNTNYCRDCYEKEFFPIDRNTILYMGAYASNKGEYPKDQFKHMSGRYYLK